MTDGDLAFWLATAAAVGMIIVEIVRLRSQRTNQLFTRTIGILMKEREHSSVTAATHMLIATAICLGAFNKEIAALAVLYTAVGDPSAAVIGERYGSIKIAGRKTLEGSLAFALAAGAVAFLVGLPATEVAIGTALVGVAAGTLAELNPWRVRLPFLGLLDDNLLVPLTSAIVMTFVTWL